MMRFLKQSAPNSDVEQSDSQSTSSEEVIAYTYEELKRSMEEAQKKHFGYKNLKDFQVEAVQATFHKKDSFLVMATGMGKSLCYQIPSIMKEAKKKFTIVISPLISLMKDQVDNLNRKKISAVYLGSGQKGNTNTILTQIKHGLYNMIYCSPEYALNNKNLFSMLKKRILLIAIDEVHCMSEWGHDFRPAYRKLNELKKIVTGIPIMCLTATCTKNVQDDILKNLQFDLKTCLIKRSSVNKQNLFYSVRIKTEIYKDLKDILDIPQKATTTRSKHFVDNSKICPYNSTLIYVNSKKECEEIHDFLKSKGLLVGMYHADMSHGDKLASHEQFLKDEIQIVVATVAFGMGIDKPDIRRIIHYGFSRSLEGYVQQVGRAGRDNGDAEAVLFFNMIDESKTKNIIIRENMANQQMVNNFERVQHIINMFTDASDYAYSSVCRRKKIYEYFDEEPKEANDIHVFDDENNKGVCFFVREWETYVCAKCDNCVNYMNIMKQKMKKESFPDRKLNKLEKLEDSVKLEDFSNELLSLLKCISALNGRTGSSTIQKILIKSKESAIVKKKYHELEVYGQGSHKSAQWWSAFMKIARNDKYIQETLNFGNDIGYVSIGLTAKGENFIKEKTGKYMVNIPTCLMSLLGPSEKAKGSMKKKEREREKPQFHYMADFPDTRADDTFSKNKKEPADFSDFSFTKTADSVGFNKKEETSSFSTNKNDTSNGISVNELNVKKPTKENKETIDKYRYFNVDKKELTKKEETVKKLTDSEINDKIMSVLLRTRMLEARKQNIPPFQLISDQPLKDICHMRLSTVKLIRKHVDNISPICPNSFLEKLVQGIRGFCLLYEIETDVNIKEYSQNNYGTSVTTTMKECSVNKFDSLISSFAYGNTKKEERFTNAPSSNYRNENLQNFENKNHSNAYNQNSANRNNAFHMNHGNTIHAVNSDTNRNNSTYTYNRNDDTNHTNNTHSGYIRSDGYNQESYISSAGRESVALPKKPINGATIDFNSFMFKSKSAANEASNLPLNANDRNDNGVYNSNHERNNTNTDQRNYIGNMDSGYNRNVQRPVTENIVQNDPFQRSIHHNNDNQVGGKRNFASTTNRTHFSCEPTSTMHPTECQQVLLINNSNTDDTNYNRINNKNTFVPPIDMFSQTPRDNSEVNNFDTNDDDFFNSFSTKPIVETGREQLSERKTNLSFFDTFAYDKNKNGNNETDIFGHSTNLSNMTFRELKKRKKY